MSLVVVPSERERAILAWWWKRNPRLSVAEADVRALARFDLPIDLVIRELTDVCRRQKDEGYPVRSLGFPGLAEALRRAQSEYHKGRAPKKKKPGRLESVGEIVARRGYSSAARG